MEALVAVGLAGNIVQFVQFSGNLISEAKAMKRAGSHTSLSRLKELSETLTRQAKIIKWLLDIATQCENAGDEFTSYLDTFGIIPEQPSFLHSAKVSAKVLQKQAKINNFVATLEQLQGSLLLATVAALRSSSTCENTTLKEHFKGLQNDARTHLQQLQRTTEVSLSGLIHKVETHRTDAQTASLKRQHEHDQRRWEEASKNLQDIQQLVNMMESRLDEKIEALHKPIETCLGLMMRTRAALPKDRADEILEWLDFRQRTWRADEINPAYRQTYDWVFKPSPEGTDLKWDNLITYLADDAPATAYFINGKAGSGKSTLMKFASHHPGTLAALKEWAGHGQHKVLVLRFYFWKIGTEIQKNHLGLLQSLLHTVLSQHPELIPAVLPNVYCNWGPWHQKEKPTYTEMKLGLELLLKRSAEFLKVCLFIDGIDEFDGDHRDMCIYLQSLASAQNVKVVVSSRPTNAPMHAFQGCPSLRLQDLTRGDMATYVNGELMSHPRMKRLLRYSSGIFLASGVAEKAEGVFLWVRVVVRLLLNGLEAGDTLEDLHHYLHALPNDLLKLYQKMMDDMQPGYRLQASQIFQVFWRWGELTQNKPFSVFRFANAFESPAYVFGIPISAIEPDEFQWVLEQTEARIRSRCCGLLEIRYRKRRPNPVDDHDVSCYSDEIDEYATVSYLHRSVAEFLESKDLWDEICRPTKGADFSPDASIVCACLSVMRTTHSITGANVWWDLDLVTRLCGEMTPFDDTIFLQFWDTIDQTMSELHNRFLFPQLPETFDHWSQDEQCKGAPRRHGNSTATSVNIGRQNLTKLEVYALFNGLERYLNLKLAQKPI
ncbi:hypothetical protein BDV96DRAFT_654889 [Lophiotrema nucula]|uniref:Uncharacterized protein n=1 Tax=Lophiotrema nucula TaxID=690887 RepID=A0A6A5YGK7_9PLEO|nr:hypothetical protein BDV96DRAFT_654889 [Lophiotrema nucula]